MTLQRLAQSEESHACHISPTSGFSRSGGKPGQLEPDPPMSLHLRASGDRTLQHPRYASLMNAARAILAMSDKPHECDRAEQRAAHELALQRLRAHRPDPVSRSMKR